MAVTVVEDLRNAIESKELPPVRLALANAQLAVLDASLYAGDRTNASRALKELRVILDDSE